MRGRSALTRERTLGLSDFIPAKPIMELFSLRHFIRDDSDSVEYMCYLLLADIKSRLLRNDVSYRADECF